MSANGNSEKHFKEEDESFKIQDRAECHSQERKKIVETKKLNKIRENKKN